MFLKNVYIRFYKSFNFDYLRKFAATDRWPWESVDGMWYPYVRIPIDRKITTVVGANESGKTHLLTAIEKGIRGEGIERADFCRYSQFFTVEQGKMKWPDFGFEWSGVSSEERKTIADCCGIMKPVAFDSFHVFRTVKDKLKVYLPGETNSAHDVTATGVSTLVSLVPKVFRLHENVGLPESASIRWLADDGRPQSNLEALTRQNRVTLFEGLLSNSAWFSTKETVSQSADKIAGAFSAGSSVPTPASNGSPPKSTRDAELRLAHDLIRKVAKIDPEALRELFDALRDGRDAFANSIIDAINATLEAVLNFPHWWVQDKQFRLLVSPRDYDLVFTICDRTGREYSFGERSSGLKYFLSYYIQYLAHEAEPGRPEILLMDEPDAYLSSQGQQDLLKILDEFANATRPGSIPTQVIYVTHSPFLIDKNHSERICVLEKGVGDEGTRVVRDTSRNHYEPLRSAFGSFVAETTFIGHCNLIVEGPADQVLLAGAASLLRSRGASELETLDLNKITIVPAGGQGQIPYLVYLARGRDVEKPAVIVFLDSDKGGNDAKKGLKRGGAKNKQVLKPQYVLQIGELSQDPTSLRNPAGNSLVEIEDLIPLPIAVEAAQRYLCEFCNAPSDDVAKVTSEAILANCQTNESLFDAITKHFESLSKEWHIDKLGFARLTLEVVVEWNGASAAGTPSEQAVSEFANNMKIVFRKLRHMQRDAERELSEERVSRRVDRAKQSFLQDYPSEAKREHAYLLLEEIEAALGGTQEDDLVRAELSSIRRDFKIEDNVTEPVPDFQRFKERLEKLKYAGRLATQDSDQATVGILPTTTATKPSLANDTDEQPTAPSLSIPATDDGQ